MFNFGMFLLVLGAVFVYATGAIVKILKKTSPNSILVVKLVGLGFSVVGAILMFLGQFPERLQFLRLF